MLMQKNRLGLSSKQLLKTTLPSLSADSSEGLASVCLLWLLVSTIFPFLLLQVPSLTKSTAVYMGEISPTEIRGSLLVLEEWFIVVGAITAFWITYGTRYIPSEWGFRLPFLLQIIPAIYLGVAAIWMPPSPRWLCQKGRDAEALATLSKLRCLPQDHSDVQAELLDIQIEAQFQRQVMATNHKVSMDRREEIPVLKDLAGFLDLFKPRCRKRTAVGVALVFFQQFVGINACMPSFCAFLQPHSLTYPLVIYYAPTIFTSIGLSYERSLLMSGIMNIIQLVGVTASIPLMDKVGRKPLLMFGAIGMLASQLCLAILVGLYSDSWPEHSAQGWVGVAFICEFTACTPLLPPPFPPLLSHSLPI